MSLLNKASLIQIPSGYKDGTLYSAKPTNGDGDFTFSRGSNLAATRVNSDGLIEKGRENLLLQSNQFDTTWTNSGTITRTGGQSGYDGSSDAWLLTKGSAGAFIRQTNSQSGVRTFSVYAKADTSDWLLLDIDGSPDAFQYFDLANGVLGATGTNIDASITNVGGSWYRCSVTGADTYTEVRIYPAEGNNDVSGTTTQLFIQDSQLESSLIATDYIETGASTAQAGILEDMPRLDYSGDCPSLLLEPQRTNLIDNTEYFGGYSFFGNASLTTNYGISPEGKQNGSRITGLDGAGTNDLRKQLSYNCANKTLSFSVYLKGSGTLRQQISNGVDQAHTQIITLTSEWKRHTLTGTFNSTSVSITYLVLDDSGVTATEYEIWGTQLEEGSYATSYIPAYGGSSVTRAYDYADNAGDASVFNDTEGVLYLESSWLSNALGTSTIAISDGTNSNRIIIGYIGLDDDLYCTSIGGGSSPSLMRYDVGDITTNHKIAIKYKANDFAFWVDGVERGTQSSGTTPVGLSELSFSSGTGGSNIYGNAKQILYFPTALTNDELATLTTL